MALKRTLNRRAAGRRLVLPVALAAVTIFALAGSGCGTQNGTQSTATAAGNGSGRPAPVTVTEAESGGSVELSVGQQLIVRLQSNPSTGYSWVPVESPGAVLQAGAASAFEQDQSGASTTLPGAGGTEVWTFTAVSSGKQKLELEYKRLWETGVPPAQTVTYNVSVE